MKLLGVDFGLKRIGLAIAESGLSRPLSVVSRPRALTEIVSLLNTQQIERIVIGWPAGSLQKEVLNFTQELVSLTGLPIDFQDETLTSREALAKMIASQKKKKVRAQEKDSWAAACLLQAYLEKIS